MDSTIAWAVELMHDFPAPWGIAGGWALDLFVGRQSRSHADVDVAILRADQLQLRSRLSGRVEKIVAGRPTEWLATEVLVPSVHEIQVECPDGVQLEFVLNEHDRASNEWVYRREARIRRSLTTAFATGGDVPYLAPEIVLLYKAKTASAKDDADLEMVLPRLSSERRAWLRSALDVTLPEHRWLTVLAR